MEVRNGYVTVPVEELTENGYNPNQRFRCVGWL